jgi:hypothetical protein
MNELQTEIFDINEEQLNALFDETPEKTVNADTLLGGKKQPVQQEEVEEDEEEVGKTKTSKKQPVKQGPTMEDTTIHQLTDEDLEEKDPEAEVDDEKAKAEKAKAKLKADGDTIKDEKKEEDAAEGADDVKSVLKSTVDYLVEQGIWQDFEGRQEMDFDNDTYAKLVAEQDKLRVESMFGELVDSTGPFGKAIIEYVKNGGNPDEIIDLFKEQKSVESIKIDSPEGQKELVKHYYTEVMGWKPEKADKYISNLVLANELEPEAGEVKELFTNYYKKEAERLNKDREDFQNQQKQAEEAFTSNIRGAIKERKDLQPNEKKMVEDYLLNYDQKLPNGNLVNKFYVNFAKMQANPQDYIDLVMFVMDKQKFMQKVSKQEESKATAKAFSFIKGNSAVSNKKGSSYDDVKKNQKVTSFDWGIPTKK